MIFDRYIFRTLLIATVFIAVALAALILLTQSLRFLELVIHAGASGMAFVTLTLLALPRFFEIILPIALMAGTLFVYHRMIADSELIVMRATGTTPARLARPAIVLSLVTLVVLWVMTMWLGPVSVLKMQEMRQIIKAQYSALLFQEGVFNAPLDGLTVFIRKRDKNGELEGLMIHDSRPENKTPVTVIARRGVLVSTPEGQQVVVYDGSRQSLNVKTGMLDRLNFDRYTIDLPDPSAATPQRWQEPDERTFWQLLHPDKDDARAHKNRRIFLVEAHRRFVTPLLAPAFALIALSSLLLGSLNRKGQAGRIALAIAAAIIIEGLYLGALSIARKHDAGLVLMYALAFVPIAAGFFALSPATESLRQKYAPLFSVRRKRGLSS